MDGGAWWATVHGVARVGHDLAILQFKKKSYFIRKPLCAGEMLGVDNAKAASLSPPSSLLPLTRCLLIPGVDVCA